MAPYGIGLSGIDGEETVDAVSQFLAATADEARPPRPATIELKHIQPEPTRWLWPGRIPAGKVTLLDGDPGSGKSLVMADVIASLTSGRAMPDGVEGDLGWTGDETVLIIGREDDLADTVVPRLVAAGADLSRVKVLDLDIGASFRGWRLDDLLYQHQRWIEKAIKRHDAAVVVVDPLPPTNTPRVMTMLPEVAQETGAAVVAIRHLTKGAGGKALYRGRGSVGIIGTARGGLIVEEHPAEPGLKVLACHKSNLAKTPPALGFRIIENAGGVPVVEWVGEVAITADELTAAPGRVETFRPIEVAKDFLRQTLAAGPRPSAEVEHEAAATGIRSATLRNARQVLGVRAEKTGWGSEGTWLWRLPDAPVAVAHEQEPAESP